MLKEEANKKYKINKITAARRQLDTAIQLWFADGDAVSICTLAFAAYEIIHKLTTGKRRKSLLFDSEVIKDEYRNEWCLWLKKHANFFKHADKDPEGVLEFPPIISEMLIMFSIQGLAELNISLNDYEAGFNHWHCFQDSKYIADAKFKAFIESIPTEQLNKIQKVKKSRFLIDFIEMRKQARLETV